MLLYKLGKLFTDKDCTSSRQV